MRVMPRFHAQPASTYWCLYSSHRSAQYAPALGFSEVNTNALVVQDSQLTTSVEMPTALSDLTVADGLPTSSAPALLVSVVPMFVSTWFHAAG